MTKVRIKGFQIFKDRHDKWRCYHRASSTPIDLVRFPIGSAEFFAECHAISQKMQAAKTAAGKPGTLGGLIRAYKEKDAWARLAPRTQADYDRVFDFLQKLDAVPIASIDTPTVARIRDKAHGKSGRWFGNYTRTVLSIIFSWGIEYGFTKSNPAAGAKKIAKDKNARDPNRPWSDAERLAVIDAAPDYMKPAFALMAYCGLGPKDALTLKRSAMKDGAITIKRSKTGVVTRWEIPSQVATVLAGAPKHDAITICANKSGKPWTQSGFDTQWSKIRARLHAAGVIEAELSLYGLRRTVAIILRESGHSERQIADALAQKSTTMAAHYARGADTARSMAGVSISFAEEVAKREAAATKPEQRLSNPNEKSVKPIKMGNKPDDE